jgi:hypothetical protein
MRIKYKTTIMILLLTGFSVNAFADKSDTLGSECWDRVQMLGGPSGGSASVYPVYEVADYCTWFSIWSKPLMGEMTGCAVTYPDAVTIKISTTNRFGEASTHTYSCAFRGYDYILDGIFEGDHRP